jgi:hypothetical protein
VSDSADLTAPPDVITADGAAPGAVSDRRRAERVSRRLTTPRSKVMAAAVRAARRATAPLSFAGLTVQHDPLLSSTVLAVLVGVLVAVGV